MTFPDTEAEARVETQGWPDGGHRRDVAEIYTSWQRPLPTFTSPRVVPQCVVVWLESLVLHFKYILKQ